MTIFSRETLLLNVLNELAEKTNLKSSGIYSSLGRQANNQSLPT